MKVSLPWNGVGIMKRGRSEGPVWVGKVMGRSGKRRGVEIETQSLINSMQVWGVSLRST